MLVTDRINLTCIIKTRNFVNFYISMSNTRQRVSLTQLGAVRQYILINQTGKMGKSFLLVIDVCIKRSFGK